ncbi:hypothetical protein PG2009B_0209 [Bifidobacterium pseudolongum subsp. globosum]|uniref:DUF881 domain-containing protein n=1 Tax=Bifidobacterium pseudolongum TaxID=1694 RepID=UPI00101F1688|nr:DUF881 domain-containing protein [Bifidobacterium pseudolongum]RYQ35571.1 hypothetical protein PG2009B_0209 [Bifidobacterium pseudolongum subsp. globosum]
MAKRTPKHGTRKTLIGSISVFLVIIFAGFLLVTNMRVNRTTTVSSDAAELVENRVKQADRLQQEVNELSAQVGALSAREDSRKSTASENAGSSTMLPAVEGPGITVTLKDSSMWQSVADTAGSSVDWDKYVVHQQDVEAVVNALWAGGAESMEVMGQRLLPTSAVICSGNVLLLQGKKYSPPFTISAIGPPELMKHALDNSRAVQIYKQYVDAFGLGYEVKDEERLEFASTPLLLQPLQYARVDE